MTVWWCEHAWLPGGPAASVRVTAGDGGTITSVEPGVAVRPGDEALPGVVLSGFADAHSHAFHRALRGRTHTGRGSFWTWRRAMYEVAERLDPDSYEALATATYAELALAGVTCVGEFHYLHHGPGGHPYGDPNAMAEALRRAARRAGVRLTLLDACYLTGGIGTPLEGPQLRFGDGDGERWASRVGLLRPDDSTRLGAAIHSVRAVPGDQLAAVATAFPGAPLHVHLSEQPAENAACLDAYGVTPTRLLHDHGALTPRTTAVHATHLTADDIALLGRARSYACFCPTTERDLADGIGPARSLADAGALLTLGSDQHSVADLLEEARALEMHERLASGERGRFDPAELVAALTADGHESLGWPEAGRIAVGSFADLVAVRLDTVRTAGSDPAQVVLSATAADVDTVVVGGRTVVTRGEHVLGDVGALLDRAVREVRE
jgi:formiminoglutamate deiminase